MARQGGKCEMRFVAAIAIGSPDLLVAFRREWRSIDALWFAEQRTGSLASPTLSSL